MIKVVVENWLLKKLLSFVSCKILGNETIVVTVENKCMSNEERNMSQNSRFK